MSSSIEAILFDVGGTLRSSLPSSEAVKIEKVGQIRDLLGIPSPVQELAALLTARGAAYRRWARENRKELSEPELWTGWMLPEFPAQQIRPHAITLNQLWREATGRRETLPETKDVLIELFRRGYRLGIVSNTASSVEVPQVLRELQISGMLDTVVLSCLAGIRKPDPAVLLDAANRMGIAPGTCAYVGDRHDRDVITARDAGFSKSILMDGASRLANDTPDDPSPAADHYIRNLRQLLEIFPPLKRQPEARACYNASCSTMWARYNFPGLPDFFEAARRLGFAKVELNHQMDSAMLSAVDLQQQAISSIHEPCPADTSTEELKGRDWLISSTDESCRRHGVEAIKRSIDLAVRLGVSVVVVHAGMVSSDSTVEQRFRKLFEANLMESEEARRARAELVEFRLRRAPACLQSVKKSLKELLEYAGRFGVRLGLENRFHYYDIPNPDEMDELLAMADPDRLGFVYDVGHAQHLDRLGFYRHEDWLRRFAPRIVEAHLHDMKGIHDHQAPGLGDVDFRMVASYLPDAAIRTLELLSTNTPEQVHAGLQHLAKCGCIRYL